MSIVGQFALAILYGMILGVSIGMVGVLLLSWLSWRD